MPSAFTQLILRLPGFLLALSVHEYAHARMAYNLGDDTAELSGRMTLEPWVHVDIVGALMLLAFGFGWARPVPVDPYRLRNPKKDMAKIALAGPAANLITAFLLEIITILLFTFRRFSGAWAYIPTVLDVAAWINAGLAIFNLIPIPPLDGSRILELYIPYRAQNLWYEFQRYSFVILAVLLILGIIPSVMQPLVTGYIRLAQKAGMSLSLLLFRP